MPNIIPLSDTTGESSDWQFYLKTAFTDLDKLANYLKLDQTTLQTMLPQPIVGFGLKAPLPYLSRIKPGDINDPLLRQILPIAAESIEVFGYQQDPLAENKFTVLPGLIHKYENRVLLTLTGVCAIHCRYCFRRHFPYDENQISSSQWQAIRHYLLAHPTVEEVILSGGDPLILKDERLKWFIREFEKIPQLKRIRIHTRVPVVIPQRITTELIQLLSQSQLPVVIVLHINHPNEIDALLAGGLLQLRSANILLFNQAVLLKGVNDDAAILAALSERLFENGVIPYYLHLLDKVQGAAHFAIDDSKAHAIYADLLKKLPGYLVPKLVTEVAGEASKRLVFPLISN